jgi:hypothetical protein
MKNIRLLVLAIFVIANVFQTFAANKKTSVLTGVVLADGKPLPGVLVSDGLQIVTTNKQGVYTMQSEKSDGFVFVITPSNYVAKSLDGLQPAFWAPLTKGEGVAEKHDFNLKKENQTRCTLFFIADAHLTNSAEKNDLEHFHTLAMPALKNSNDSCSHLGPVYTINLGDLSHDIFWYQCHFNIADAKELLIKEGYPNLMYSVPGNHDNDGAIAGVPDVDFKAEWLYRKTFGPTYYSMNIGGVHFIMIDDIIYRNTANKGKKAPGIAGARDYDKGFTPSEMAWLAQDLKYVDPHTPVYVCTHSPLLFDNPKGSLFHPAQMDSINHYFSKFDQVNVFAGHLHKMTCLKNKKYPHLMQYVVPALSGNMWTTCNNGFHSVGLDGVDAGFVMASIGNAKVNLSYQTLAYGHKVLRTYDMNEVGAYYRQDEGVRNQLSRTPTRVDYGLPSYNNFVYVDYWCYRPGEKVEMYENGNPLSVQKVPDEDPLFFISYSVPHGVHSFIKDEIKNPHMFAAQATDATSPIEIRILSKDGKLIHKEMLVRPKKFDKDIK